MPGPFEMYTDPPMKPPYTYDLILTMIRSRCRAGIWESRDPGSTNHRSRQRPNACTLFRRCSHDQRESCELRGHRRTPQETLSQLCKPEEWHPLPTKEPRPPPLGVCPSVSLLLRLEALSQSCPWLHCARLPACEQPWKWSNVLVSNGSS